MDYQAMTKEDLIKEIEKLNKKLYHKQAARLSWKKIMSDKLVYGPDYWSNGHFALKNIIPIPEAVSKLKDLYPRDTDVELEVLIGKNEDGKEKEQTPTDKKLWKEGDNKQIITEHGAQFQKIYTDVLEKLVPGYSLRLTGYMSPALIYKDGDMIGLLMPLRDEVEV